MDEIITIDRAGRVVIPIFLRRRLHLVPGCRLRIRDHGPQIVMEPVPTETPVIEKDGLLVLPGSLGISEVDHRTVREERLDRLTPRP